MSRPPNNRPARANRSKPPLRLQPTTLWDYPSQDYGEEHQGIPGYKGATPSYIIWNLLQRYTKPNELVIDPCCGSGTTLDVARDLNRKALGYDVHPKRKDIFRVDARKLPAELTGKVDFVFIDPPYSTHLDYGDDPRDIGKLSAKAGEYYVAMKQVIGEIIRVLKPGRHMALYVSDSYEHNAGAGRFYPLGFELFRLMVEQGLEPADVVSVVRHNRTLDMGNYRKAAEDGNYFLRGFNYLFIMRKPGEPIAKPAAASRG
jgi:adenine-specific DNA-methyltransferase